jgi:hypothetical protein
VTPPVNTQTVTVTDPGGKTASYVYATGALVRLVSVLLVLVHELYES